jgi:XTP/dITP diphosphohydrolase
MRPERILLATGNAHKASEIAAILGPLLPGVKLLSLRDVGLSDIPDDVESGETFAENAAAKAVWCRDQSGMACIADDSGLCVDALGGAPGVRSARWAGPTDADRNIALMRALEEADARGPDQRRAKFVSCVAYAPLTGEVVLATGEVEGRIIEALRSGGGFGYDPLFYAFDLGETFGNAGAEAKNEVSHRSRALRVLATKL